MFLRTALTLSTEVSTRKFPKSSPAQLSPLSPVKKALSTESPLVPPQKSRVLPTTGVSP